VFELCTAETSTTGDENIAWLLCEHRYMEQRYWFPKWDVESAES
jgi:hypothetical protein